MGGCTSGRSPRRRWRRCGARREAAASSGCGSPSASFSRSTGISSPRPSQISLLPPAHLIVLPEELILEDLADLIEAEAEHLAGPSGYMALMTGPSRTADIEKVLTIGVHGPGRLAVALV